MVTHHSVVTEIFLLERLKPFIHHLLNHQFGIRNKHSTIDKQSRISIIEKKEKHSSFLERWTSLEHECNLLPGNYCSTTNRQFRIAQTPCMYTRNTSIPIDDKITAFTDDTTALLSVSGTQTVFNELCESYQKFHYRDWRKIKLLN